MEPEQASERFGTVQGKCEEKTAAHVEPGLLGQGPNKDQHISSAH